MHPVRPAFMQKGTGHAQAYNLHRRISGPKKVLHYACRSAGSRVLTTVSCTGQQHRRLCMDVPQDVAYIEIQGSRFACSPRAYCSAQWLRPVRGR